MQEKRQRSLLLSGGAELLHFLAALAILHQGELKNRQICTLFLNSSWCKSAYSSICPGAKQLECKELKQFFPPKSNDDPCHLFCVNPSYMVGGSAAHQTNPQKKDGNRGQGKGRRGLFGGQKWLKFLPCQLFCLRRFERNGLIQPFLPNRLAEFNRFYQIN